LSSHKIRRSYHITKNKPKQLTINMKTKITDYLTTVPVPPEEQDKFDQVYVGPEHWIEPDLGKIKRKPNSNPRGKYVY